ncbi:MAG: DUF6607 family protein [Marinicella sp.]
MFRKRNFITVIGLLIFNQVCAYENNSYDECESSQEQYIFSWALSNTCDDKPRGGTSQGIDVEYDKEPHAGWLKLQQAGLNKFEQDRTAILAMAGPYRVDFNFLETVGFSEYYKRDRPYHSWGTEYVFVVTDEPEFISLQHIMVMYFKTDDGGVSEPMVMKHWRQDWTYQDDTIWEYQGNNSWKKQGVEETMSQGSWSQAVFQVDDSPRYESIGKWQHNPSFSTWISDTTQRPLPRREYSVRDDYHILEGFNRHTINRFGWVQEEENWKKTLNDDGSVKAYQSKEEGVGRYRRIVGTDFQPGIDYMAKAGLFWADVRLVWDELLTKNSTLGINKKVDKVSLFMPLFAYAQEVMDGDDYDSKKGMAKARQIIQKHIRD